LIDIPPGPGPIPSIIEVAKEFIFKPYIEIKIKLENEKQINLNINKKNVAVFNLNIWRLYVENKGNKLYRFFSRDANSFHISLNIIKDKRVMNNPECILLWMNNNLIIPSEFEVSTNYEIKETDYLKTLLNELEIYLRPDVGHTVNLPTSTEQDIIFLISIHGLNHIYLLHQVPIRYAADELRYEVESISLPFDKYIMNFRFHIKERKGSMVKNMELKIKTWDNIEFKKKFLYKPKVCLNLF
jgi:hypothetical protein